MVTMKLVGTFLLLDALALSSVYAAEPRWWTEMKRNCRAQGGQISEYSNSYTGCHLPKQEEDNDNPPGPHLVRVAPHRWKPDRGYFWVADPDQGDFRVEWRAHQRVANLPHIQTSEEEGSWTADPGYVWVSPGAHDLSVEWAPHRHFREHPNIETSDEEGKWHPDPGYDWVSRSSGELRVRWNPHSQTDRGHPHLEAAVEPGKWHPAAGYVWLTMPPGDDMEVVKIPASYPPNASVESVYIFCACMSADDLSAACSKDVGSATTALVESMAEQAANRMVRTLLTVRFEKQMVDRAEQIKFLVKLERKAVARTQQLINYDLKKQYGLTRQMPSHIAQAAIASDVILLKKIHQQAVEQANAGDSWEHNWNTRSHTFQHNAYQQATEIHFSGYFPQN